MPTLRRAPLLLAITASLSLSLAACSGDTPPSAPAAQQQAAAEQAPRPQLGSFGFDADGMDRSIAAGDNFFDFANGTWVKNTEIPADRSRFGSFNVIAEKTQADTRAILEGAANNAQASGEDKLIGDYYAAFMDEAGIEQRGLAPVQPQLQAIDALADKAALARALGADVRADVDLLNATNFYTDRLFGLWVSVDLLQPARTAPYLCRAAWACRTVTSTWAMAAWPSCAGSTRNTSARY